MLHHTQPHPETSKLKCPVRNPPPELEVNSRSAHVLAMSAAAPAPADGVLNLKVSSPDNDDIYFKLKLTTKLVKVYKAVADRKGLEGPKFDGSMNESLSFRLMFDGGRLNMMLTPADYDMEDNDVVDFFVQAEGGCHV